jgi:hypothetical protein
MEHPSHGILYPSFGVIKLDGVHEGLLELGKTGASLSKTPGDLLMPFPHWESQSAVTWPKLWAQR